MTRSTVAEPENRYHRLFTLIFYSTLILGFILNLYIDIFSTGAYLDDEIGHLIIARGVWRDPTLIFSDWGRIGTTLTFAIPAGLFGLVGARIWASLLLACSVVLIAKIAQKLNCKYYWATPVLFWFQPWIASWGGSCLTETPLLFFWVLALYLLFASRLSLSALCFGVLPLIRQETIIITAGYTLYCLWQRRPIASLLAWAPSVLVNLVGKLWLNHLPFNTYLRPNRTKMYGEGEWWHFLEPIVGDAGLIVVVLSVIGIFILAKRPRALTFCSSFLIYLLTHTIVYHFGLYASGGFSIFLLPIAPMLTVLAAGGLESLDLMLPLVLKRMSHEAVRKITLGISIILLSLCAHSGLQVTPYKMRSEQILMRDLATWLTDSKLTFARIVSTHVWAYYYLDILPPHPQSLWIPRGPLSALPPDTAVIWDNHYSERWGYNLSTLQDDPVTWELVRDFGAAKIFRKKE